MDADQNEVIRAAVAAELRLLDPAVRSSPALASELLDERFVEFGASGRRWDRESVLSAMTPDQDDPGQAITATEMTGVVLAPGLVHLTYLSDDGRRRARRSSLWRQQAPNAWLLLFHQGTPIEPASPASGHRSSANARAT